MLLFLLHMYLTILAIYFENFSMFLRAASATFFFDKRLNLIKDEAIKKENQDFFDALQTMTLETAKIMSVPEEILNMFPESRNPIKISEKCWDVLFSLGTYNFCFNPRLT